MKRKILVLGLILLIVGIMNIGAYEPLTHAEAYDWLVYWTDTKFEHILDAVIALDYIEHAEPEIDLPDVVVLLEGRDLHLSYNPPRIDLRVGPLQYGIPLPILEWPGFVPESPKRARILAWGIGIGSAGTIVMISLIKSILR